MGPLLAFTALIVFMGHWGWTFVAFTVFVLFMECLGWMFMKFTAFLAFVPVVLCIQRVSSVYGALGWTCGAFLQHLWHLWGVGVVRLALGSCLAFFLFLHAQHRWVPPGLAYWGSGFSQP